MSLYRQAPPVHLLPDPAGLREYSVVFSDHALNHMSKQFMCVMKDLDETLRELHHADGVILVPGGGTFAMESIARHVFLQEPLASRKCVIVRNGWFSYRWSQILEDCGLVLHDNARVLKARRAEEARGAMAPFAPPPIAEVVAAIAAVRPQVVFVAHVETSSGILLPNEYISSISAAAHQIGAIVVLDCIASGSLFVNMEQLKVDLVVAAPQKSYSGPAGCGIVMHRGDAVLKSLKASGAALFGGSFAADLRKWFAIAEAYRNGGAMYHATMPTDMLKAFRDQLLRMKAIGFAKLTDRQWALGRAVRMELEKRGFRSVAAQGFQSPTVVVSYTTDDSIKSGKAFADCGIQSAAGVPLQCDEGPEFRTFRLGLFGLFKFQDVSRTVEPLAAALESISLKAEANKSKL